ncbi:MAG: hypothetical protein ACRDBL_01145 [Rhabdaerophilum sp.]
MSILRAILSGVMFSVVATGLSAQTASNRFEFVAIGDMPYTLPKDYEKVDRLIGAINAAKPAFTIHIGDIKSGSTHCSDEIIKKAFDQIQTLEGPVVFTPGDNEWTDCHRQSNGSYDPLERLAHLRKLFYVDPAKSIGKAPMAVESQAKIMADTYATFVENARFIKNGVLFVTVHVVGSNNNLEPRDRKAANEFFDRNEANTAWLNAAFKKAKDENLKAVVVAAQANLYDIKQDFPAIPSASGFLDTIKAIEAGSKLFDRPILYVHGDEHRFVIDRMVGTNLKPIAKTKRLQVYGANQVHGVRVTVDPDSPGVFGFIPLIVAENGEY